MDQKGSLKESMVIRNKLGEVFVTSSNSGHDVFTFIRDNMFLGSHQVLVVLDMNDRNGEAIVSYQSLDFFFKVKWILSSFSFDDELDWRVSK